MIHVKHSLKNMHLKVLNKIKFTAWAKEVATSVKFLSIICLRGNLGVGKSTFAKNFIQSKLGSKINIKSPTFNIVERYIDSAGKIIFHWDLYRIIRYEELIEIGFEDALNKGLNLIEWPEIAMCFLNKIPFFDIQIEFDAEKNKRKIITDLAI